MAGRPPTYNTDDERPVSVSLRVPKALYEQAQHYARQRRMSMTELLVDGLQMRLETPTDPRELFMSDNSNTVLQQLRDELKGALLAELRQDVAELLAAAAGDGLGTGASVHLRPVPHELSSDNGNTVLQHIQPGESPVPDGLRQCKRGLHTYPTSLRECPECRRDTKRAYKQRLRERKAAQQTTATL